MNQGNGALQKLEKYFDTEYHVASDLFEDPMTKATYLLVWLYAEGFKIIPTEESNDAIRHG